MKKALNYIQNLTLTQGLIVFAVIGLGGYILFFRGGAPEVQTIVIAPSPFMQQVSVSGRVVAAQDVDLGFSQGGRVSRV